MARVFALRDNVAWQRTPRNRVSLACCVRLEKHDRVTRDRLAATNRPDVLAGLGLDVHGRFVDAQQAGEVLADRLLVRSQPRFLGVDDDVAIDGPPPGLLDPSRRPPPGAACCPGPATWDRCPG